MPPAVTRGVPMPQLPGTAEKGTRSEEEAANAVQEAKRRDRAATVARMKERMRVMGIEKAKKAAEEASGNEDGKGGLSTVYEQTGASYGSDDPSLEETNVMPTASMAARKQSQGAPQFGTLRSPSEIAAELKSKANNYRSVLRYCCSLCYMPM